MSLTHRFRRLVRRISARSRLAVGLVGVLAFSISMALSLISPPLPSIHDEFSYLLAADTYASGRLSNPTHPFWTHFETFHVLQTPRYASKYPPAQGMFLAVGQRLTGWPIVGAWLGVSLGCAGVCWMLQGWTRPRWAFLGGVLAAVHHGVHGGLGGWGSCYSWSQTFWGGGPAMLGGALVLGALPRLARRPRWGDSLCLGGGLIVLANSRPFEGFLVSFPVVVAVGWLAFRSRPTRRAVVLPMVILLGLAGVGMALMNRAVTGSMRRMPYSAYESTYNPAPIFVGWRKPGPTPSYRHRVIETFFTEFCIDQYTRQRTPAGWWRYHSERLGWLWAFFVGPLLIPLMMLARVVRRAGNAFAAAECTAVVVAHLATVGIQPHYAAPVMGCFLLLVVEGMRRLDVVRIGPRRVGRLIVLLTWLLVFANLGAVAYVRASSRPGWESERARVASTLGAMGGRHLVVVRYRADHNIHHEWVYNASDIDGSAVVWAREMNEPAMRSLLRYFGDRRAWVLEADVTPPRLSAYEMP